MQVKNQDLEIFCKSKPTSEEEKNNQEMNNILANDEEMIKQKEAIEQEMSRILELAMEVNSKTHEKEVKDAEDKEMIKEQETADDISLNKEKARKIQKRMRKHRMV